MGATLESQNRVHKRRITHIFILTEWIDNAPVFCFFGQFRWINDEFRFEVLVALTRILKDGGPLRGLQVRQIFQIQLIQLN